MNAASASSLKQRLGCWLHERWRTELVLRSPRLSRAVGLTWLDLRNRNERLREDPISGGRICDWVDSSRFTAARVSPEVSRRLLAHVLTGWPIRFNAGARELSHDKPEVSILIPMGGTGRLSQFVLTLQAARAQVDVALEIIVVEQSPKPLLADRLPPDVRHLHQPGCAEGDFNKSSALNLGARAATGECLIVLDADYLLPQRFASECARVLKSVEAIRPARWIFYVDKSSTDELSSSHDCRTITGIEHIVSNNPTPIAVRRDTYWAIGGHDESYVGWGGEDLEFLDRLRTHAISEGGWMPVLHAWHAPAPKKANGDRNRVHHEAKMLLPASQRIESLSSNRLSRAHAVDELAAT